MSCTIYKIPVHFSLSLDMKPGTGNPKLDKTNETEKEEREKDNTSKGITFFPENFHRDERFHLNIPRISGFSIQMVSALYVFCFLKVTFVNI